MSSGGIGTPDTMYLKMRAWCSSSCHWVGVKGDLISLALVVAPVVIIFEAEKGEEKERCLIKDQELDDDAAAPDDGICNKLREFCCCWVDIFEGYFCRVHWLQNLLLCMDKN